MNILKAEKFPYLLTVLFVLIGWSLTHSVDRFLNSPIIEYKLKKDCCTNEKEIVSYEISNISTDRLFENIEFKLLCKRGSKGKFFQANVKLPPPMDLPEEVQRGDQYVKFFVPELHPGWKLILTVEMSKNLNPSLHFLSKSSGKENKPIRLLPSSFKTLIIKHELEIIAGLILLWSVLIVLYLVFVGEKSNPAKEPCLNKTSEQEAANA